MIPEYPQLTSAIVTLTYSAAVQLRKGGILPLVHWHKLPSPQKWYHGASLHACCACSHVWEVWLPAQLLGVCGLGWGPQAKASRIRQTSLVRPCCGGRETRAIVWCRMGDAQTSLARQRL